MPPRRRSRYTFATAVRGDDDRVALYGDEPYRFHDFADNIEHVVRRGDTLHRLAAKYFVGEPRPAGLWWVIAHFQPDPIHDPTIVLDIGRVLYVPSMRTLTEEIFNERRRRG